MYTEDITWWQEDKNVMFEWQEQHCISEHSERVKYVLATRTQEKNHIFELKCNFLFIIWIIDIHGRDSKDGFNTNIGY